MPGNVKNVIQSRKVRGALWILAALLMFSGPVIFDGSTAAGAIGILFLVFGLVTLRKDRADGD